MNCTFSAQAWGSTAQKSSGERFGPTTSKKIPSGAFRGFGSDVNLCPGRFFTMTEIVALVAMLVMRYDLKPVDGLWVGSRQNLTNMSLAIAPPKRKIIVDVVNRKGWEGGSWAFKN